MTDATYQFKWGKATTKPDPRHTISGLEANPYLDYWISTLRKGTPWQLVNAATGAIVKEGVR